MTISTALAGFPVLLVPGLLFLLFGTWQAVRQRENLKRLICWGALQDAGVVCIALECPAPALADALPLFILFQAATRLLALSALGDLAKGLTPALSALRGVGRQRPVSGALLGLGLMASVGGSPFFVPEARLRFVQGYIYGSPSPELALPLMLLMLVCTLVLLALNLHAVQVALLESRPAHAPALPEGGRAGVFSVLLALVVALAGLFRNEMISFLESGWLSPITLHHPEPHVAFWLFYAGAALGGAGCLLRNRLAPWTVVLTSALALASVFIYPVNGLSQFFLALIGLVAAVVSCYSLDYMAHDEHPARYWFFLPLTFAALAGIVSEPDLGALLSLIHI